MKHSFTKLYLFSLFLLFIGISNHSQAQDQKQAGFDTTAYHPLYIQSQNGKFKFNLGLYTQFRLNTNIRSNTPDSVESFSNGYNLARTRFFMEGNYTEKFYFHIRSNMNPSGNIEAIAVYLQYNINKKMWLRMGKQFMALGLEDWMLPQDLASMEFSAHNFTYAIWNSFGFLFHHKVSKNFRYWLSLGNGAYGGRRQFPGPKDADFTVITRMELNLLNENWGIWDDMLGRRGRDFGMLLGFGGGLTSRSKAEDLLTDAKTAYQLNFDYSITGNGFRFFSHFTFTSRTFDQVPEAITGMGFYSTFGYWFNKGLFGYLRYDLVTKGVNSGATEDYSSPGLGISYYPFNWSNRYRFTLEYNYLGATINNTLVQPDGQLGVIASDWGAQQSIRLQIQFGF